ncbi:hypothetical protein B0H13DRAFT_1915030 [Mycena leptocephala]|nr:hypothetical protein B0H13DRAFT_1915030 [Mycena leptocephala]
MEAEPTGSWVQQEELRRQTLEIERKGHIAVELRCWNDPFAGFKVRVPDVAIQTGSEAGQLRTRKKTSNQKILAEEEDEAQARVERASLIGKFCSTYGFFAGVDGPPPNQYPLISVLVWKMGSKITGKPFHLLSAEQIQGPSQKRDPDGDVQYSQTSWSSYNNRVTWNDTCLFQPALANRDIRLRLIQRVKEELNGPEQTGDVRTQVAVYLAQQQALPPAQRYLQSSIIRDGRTVIFGIHPELIKNIHRSMQIFEVNAWLTAINEAQRLGYRHLDNCALRAPLVRHDHPAIST